MINGSFEHVVDHLPCWSFEQDVLRGNAGAVAQIFVLVPVHQQQEHRSHSSNELFVQKVEGHVYKLY